MCHVAWPRQRPYTEDDATLDADSSDQRGPANGAHPRGRRAAESARKRGGTLVISTKFFGHLVICPMLNYCIAPAPSPNLRANQRGAAVNSSTGRGHFGHAENVAGRRRLLRFCPSAS